MLSLFVLEEFFKRPRASFHIRQLARLLDTNHMTVRKYLHHYVDQGYLQKDSSGLYPVFKAKLTPQFLNLKLYYNLEQLRKSSLITYLNAEFDYPQLVLFGSYATAHDTSDSDIDICMITNIQKEYDLAEFEHFLGRSIDLRKYCEDEWKDLIKDNPELVNNIAKGIVLSDEFEVIR